MSNLQLRNFKVYLPQLYGTLIVCLVYMCVSSGVVYSAILIPRLKDESDSLQVSEAEQLWIVNCVNLVAPLLAVFSGFATDKCGRLWVLKSTVVPHVLGWATVALATTSTMLLIGRVLTGFAIAFQVGPSFVYISEISAPSARSALLGLPVVSFGLGSLLTYFCGSIAPWRTVAWISCAHGITAVSLLYTLHSSPSWLVSKNRTAEAKKSIAWLYKYHTGDPTQHIEREIVKMQDEQNSSKKQNQKSLLQIMCLPIVYKPLAILSAILVFQQLAGVYVLLMNTVIFIQETGSKTDPFVASNYLAIVRFVMTILSIWLMKKFGRRPLLTINFLGMAISILISGLYSKWIADGVTEQTWVPLLMLSSYTIFTTLVVSVPFALAGELFPLSVRGIFSNVVIGLLFIFSFAVVFNYPSMLVTMGGIHHLQYFYGVMSLLGAIVTYLFVPETLNKPLSEIEHFFWTHTLAVGKSTKIEVKITDCEL